MSRNCFISAVEIELELNITVRFIFIPGFIPKSENLIWKTDGSALSGFLLSWREGRISELFTVAWISSHAICWLQFPEVYETISFHLKKGHWTKGKMLVNCFERCRARWKNLSPKTSKRRRPGPCPQSDLWWNVMIFKSASCFGGLLHFELLGNANAFVSCLCAGWFTLCATTFPKARQNQYCHHARDCPTKKTSLKF